MLTVRWSILLAVVLVAAACLSVPSTAEAGEPSWRTADQPQPGYDLTKLCLAQRNGRWASFRPETSLLRRDAGGRAGWARDLAGQTLLSGHVKPHASKIYRIKDSYALGYLFSARPGMVMHAWAESGMLQRLDGEIEKP
ncbi:hypothetical protein [Geminicoccus flavidas]|uniref:hypothetical protein n=1 Tax=Geminicoccus flavidas TaxID=2506407 RepID=UPI001357E0C0|nr:hypothetical protein [Geminicoccus flavidas]